MQPMRPKVVGGAIVVEENGEGGGGDINGLRGGATGEGRESTAGEGSPVAWSLAALHRLGDGAAGCVRLRKRHRIGSRGVVLIEIPCQAVAGD